MKKIKILILISIAFMSINILFSKKIYAVENSYVNQVTNYKAVVEDDANLLTEEEEEILFSQMKELTQHGNIGFKSISINNANDTKKYAEMYYQNKFGKENGTVFLIDMYYREIYIYSYGQNYKFITNSKARVITDNIYKMATNKDYYGCAKEAYTEILAVLNKERIAQPMKYICNIIISLLAAQLIVFTKIERTLNLNKPKNKELVSNANNKFSSSVPTPILVKQRKVYSPISSDDNHSFGGR